MDLVFSAGVFSRGLAPDLFTKSVSLTLLTCCFYRYRLFPPQTSVKFVQMSTFIICKSKMCIETGAWKHTHRWITSYNIELYIVNMSAWVLIIHPFMW